MLSARRPSNLSDANYSRRTVLAMAGPLIIGLPFWTGCIGDLASADRMARGLVVILPGIEGPGLWNHELARGLDEGGVGLGIEIYDWGTPVPFGAVVNLTDYERNLRVAGEVREHILAYQSLHRGKPVHLIGHSGGGGMAVMTLEAMKPEEQITSVILLAAAVSPRHELRSALARSRYGIFNYYSNFDMAYLGIGTTVFGTMDRYHGLSAGAVGFEPTAYAAEDRAGGVTEAAHRPPQPGLLHQIAWSTRMESTGNFGGHADWTNRTFVKTYLGPLVASLSSDRWLGEREPELLAGSSADR